MCQYCVAYQALFVQAVTQTTPVVVGADVEATQDVIGPEELRQVGQVRVGFDQVAASRVRVANEQSVIAFGQLEGRASGRVHGGERNAAVVHRSENGLHAAIGGDALDGLDRRHGRSARVGGLFVDGDVDATDLDTCLILTQLSGEYFRGIVGAQRAVLHSAGDVQVDRTTRLKRGGVFGLRAVCPHSDIALFFKATVGGTSLEHFKTCQVKVASSHSGFEGRDVDKLHLVPVAGVDPPWCTDRDAVLPGAL